MIVAFCGHSTFLKSVEYEKKVIAVLEELVGDATAQMYLGGYGAFDEFAYACCKKYKANHPNVSLVYITPYISPEYQSSRLIYIKEVYDEILYPPIEDKPPRFAISYRNRWMVENAQYVISFVEHTWGGAYQTYKHAKRKGKMVFNISDILVE